jgi:hypothetical protein
MLTSTDFSINVLPKRTATDGELSDFIFVLAAGKTRTITKSGGPQRLDLVAVSWFIVHRPA